MSHLRNLGPRLLALGILGILLPACGIGGAGTLSPTVAPGIPAGVTARTASAQPLVFVSKSCICDVRRK